MRRWLKWAAWIFVVLVAWAILESFLRVLLLGTMLGGAYLAATAGLALVRKRSQPQLTAEPAELRPGQPFVVRYGPPRLPTEGLRGVRLRLICRESRERPANGRTVTDKHDWVVEEADGDVSGELQLAIPDDAMHSFGSRHHEIAWLVEAQGRVRGSKEGPLAVATLTVLPARYEA
jgi:hypothetical protein